MWSSSSSINGRSISSTLSPLPWLLIRGYAMSGEGGGEKEREKGVRDDGRERERERERERGGRERETEREMSGSSLRS